MWIIGGFLDRLPPELQRAGRDVFNTAKTKTTYRKTI